MPSPFQALRISHRDVRGTRVTGDEVQMDHGNEKQERRLGTRRFVS